MCDAVSEVLHDILGIHPQGAYPERKVDLRFDLEVTLETLLWGSEEEIRFERVRYCPECRSNGNSRSSARGPAPLPRDGRSRGTTVPHGHHPPGCTHQSRIRIPGVGDQPHPRTRPGDLVIVCHLVEFRDP